MATAERRCAAPSFISRSSGSTIADEDADTPSVRQLTGGRVLSSDSPLENDLTLNSEWLPAYGLNATDSLYLLVRNSKKQLAPPVRESKGMLARPPLEQRDRDLAFRARRERAVAKARDDASMREVWLADIIDKQYRLYVWNDGKLQAVATINGLLITAAGFLFKTESLKTFENLLLGISLSLLFLSLGVCLYRIIRFPLSRKTEAEWPNIRSNNGIIKFNSWEEYEIAVILTSKSRFLTHSVRQAWGMALNNRRIHSLMEAAVWFTIIGGGFLAMGVFFHFFADSLPPNDSSRISNQGDSSKYEISCAAPNFSPSQVRVDHLSVTCLVSLPRETSKSSMKLKGLSAATPYVAKIGTTPSKKTYKEVKPKL